MKKFLAGLTFLLLLIQSVQSQLPTCTVRETTLL